MHPAFDETYKYNGDNELTSVSGGENQTWTLDGMGNLGPANTANQLASCGYDHNGNMTSDGTNGDTYKYDAWNRLVEVDNSAGKVLAEYQYDGTGRKVLNADATTTPGTLDRFSYTFYAGQQAVETRDSASVTSNPQSLAPTFQYVWSSPSSNTPILRDACDGSGQPIAADRIYYLADANNNVTSLVNSSGSVFERYVYTPYGQGTIYDSTWSTVRTQSSYANTIRFAAMALDPVTGLYGTQTRWYQPATGTFISRDPAQADANLYRYCGDNPIDHTDPTGLKMSWSVSTYGYLAGVWDGHGPMLPVQITVDGQTIWVMPTLQPDGTYAAVPPKRWLTFVQPGFLSDYWFYLWNPSKEDLDIKIYQGLALGTATVTGIWAGGLLIAGWAAGDTAIEVGSGYIDGLLTMAQEAEATGDSYFAMGLYPDAMLLYSQAMELSQLGVELLGGAL